MFLLENKLQSFYEDIKKLNEVSFKLKDNEEEQKFIEKLKPLKNNSLNTNTYGMTEGETNVYSEKSNPCHIDSEKSGHRPVEINKILIQNPNKSKPFNGKNECEAYNKKQNVINSPSGTIIKCGERNKKTSELYNQEQSNDDCIASDYSLVKKNLIY